MNLIYNLIQQRVWHMTEKEIDNLIAYLQEIKALRKGKHETDS